MKRKGGALTRRTATRNPKPKCIIFCEGEKSEPTYLQALKLRHPKCLFDIECVRGAGVPKTLLERALERKRNIKRSFRHGKSFSENDQIWVVFDEDEHPHVPQTLNNARDNGISVAYSNPCFELWLILHEEQFDRPEHRHDVQRRCESIVNGYDRRSGKCGDFLALLDRLEDAEHRADELLRRRQEEAAPLSNPSTTFHFLTKALLSELDPKPNPT